MARVSDWQLLFVDAKGDERTQRRFHALMADVGREALLSPHECYDGWRGSAREITNRLIALIDFATEGGGTYYRDTATNIVRLATAAAGGPPRSAAELLSRLNRERLEALYVGRPEADDVGAYSTRQIDECRQRYQSFFRSVSGRVDGSWAFEDADCGYLLLNELLYGEETAKLARFLIEDFKQYAAQRKPRGRRTLLIVDEFSGLAEGAPLARVVETVRSPTAPPSASRRRWQRAWADPRPRRGSSARSAPSSCISCRAPRSSCGSPARGWWSSRASSTRAARPRGSARRACSTPSMSTRTRSGRFSPACAL